MDRDSREDNPEAPVRPVELGPVPLPFEHHDLVAQGQNFQGEIVPRSKERKRIGQNDPKKGQHDPLTLMANSLPSTIS